MSKGEGGRETVCEYVGCCLSTVGGGGGLLLNMGAVGREGVWAMWVDTEYRDSHGTFIISEEGENVN